MAGEGKLLVLQREHEDLEAALGLVVVPMVRTVQRLFQGELRSIFSHLFIFHLILLSSVSRKTLFLNVIHRKYLFQNGDYSCDIPEQYATPNVCTRYCSLSEASDNRHKNKLCEYCNQRESLKLSELSNFEPKNERHFDAELKAFKEYLEVSYPLCDGCKLTVRDVLRKQAMWLTHYKMLFFRQKPIKVLVDVSTFVESRKINITNILGKLLPLMFPTMCSCGNKLLLISTVAECKKVGNNFPSCLDNSGLDGRVQPRLHLAANWWTVFSPVRILGELNEKQKVRCIINIVVVLRYYPHVRQEFDDSSKCLAYN